MDWLEGRTVLVLGLGESGLAMARWCARLGAQVRVWDTREQPANAGRLAQAVPTARRWRGPLGDEALVEVALVLKSPGLSPRDARVAPLLERAAALGLPVQGELALFARALDDLRAACGYVPKLLAVTGTNGKTTTTAMTAALVARTGRRVAMAGNIGPTMLQTLADALDREGDIAVPGALRQAQGEREAGNGALRQAQGEREVGNRALQQAQEEREVGNEALRHSQGEREVGNGAPRQAQGEREAGNEALQHAEDKRDASARFPPVRAEPVEALVETPPTDEHGADLADLHALDGAAANDAEPLAPVFAHLPDVWILELSSFQLDGVRGFEPAAAAVLNLTEDHLDWHGAMAGYSAAKARIFGTRAIMVVNADDPGVEALVPAATPAAGKLKARKPVQAPRRVVRFGLGRPRHAGDFGLVDENGMAWMVRACVADETLQRGRGSRAAADEALSIQRLMPADALRVRGRHNAANALAALALATAIGCPLAPMLHALRDYAGEPHRVEFIATIDGIDAVDDSKGTNVGATVAALTGLGADREPGRLVVILGGDGKGQDFAPLAAPVRRHARAVATLGRDAERIEQALAATGVPTLRHPTLEAATRWCFEVAEPGDAVLLSPACASLDMFRDYAHRAEVFVAEVRAIAADRGGLS